MRVLKFMSALAIVALALTALGASTASAFPEFLPGTAGTTFTNDSKKATLTAGGLSIVCQKSKSTGELQSSLLALITIDFEECTVAGLAVNSLGDSAKTILVHVEAKTCIIKEGATLIGGLLLKPLPVHLEVPAAKLLILVEGDVIARLLPENGAAGTHFTLDLKGSGGQQEFKECKDAVGETSKVEDLKSKDDAAEAVLAIEEVEGGLLDFPAGNPQVWMT